MASLQSCLAWLQNLLQTGWKSILAGRSIDVHFLASAQEVYGRTCTGRNLKMVRSCEIIRKEGEVLSACQFCNCVSFQASSCHRLSFQLMSKSELLRKRFYLPRSRVYSEYCSASNLQGPIVFVGFGTHCVFCWFFLSFLLSLFGMTLISSVLIAGCL